VSPPHWRTISRAGHEPALASGMDVSGMINYTCASVLPVSLACPSMTANSRLQPALITQSPPHWWMDSVSHASTVITWDTRPSRDHHPKDSRFSRPMTTTRLVVCSLGRGAVVLSALTSAVDQCCRGSVCCVVTV
jgi:hypothetical protein